MVSREFRQRAAAVGNTTRGKHSRSAAPRQPLPPTAPTVLCSPSSRGSPLRPRLICATSPHSLVARYSRFRPRIPPVFIAYQNARPGPHQRVPGMRGVHPEQVDLLLERRGAEAAAASDEGGGEQVGVHADGLFYWQGH